MLSRLLARKLSRPLSRPLTRLAGGPSLDSAAAAYKLVSGATDIAGIDAIARYMRAEGLRDNYRLYPQKSAQNTGSGSTVYGIGGLTANHMALVNSPTWGASGILFNSTNQFGHITDFLDAATITVMCRRSGESASGVAHMFGQWDFAADKRSFAGVVNNNDAVTLSRSSDGTLDTLENQITANNVRQLADTTYVAQWIAGGGRAMWRNKTSQSLTLSGTAQTTRLNSDAPIMLNAVGTAASAASFMGGTYTAFLVVRGTLTTAQRETLTDLVNAL